MTTKNEKILVALSSDHYINDFHTNIENWLQSTDGVPEEYKNYISAKILNAKLETREKIIADLNVDIKKLEMKL
jgi:hypothetical protein